MALTGRIQPRDTNLGQLVARCAHLRRDPNFGLVVEALIDLAREQDDFNKDKWAEHQGQPAKHARTHMGGDDSVISVADPADVALVAAPGNPRLGAAAAGHVHAIGNLLDSNAWLAMQGLV